MYWTGFLEKNQTECRDDAVIGKKMLFEGKEVGSLTQGDCVEWEEKRDLSPRNMDVWSQGRNFLLVLCLPLLQFGSFIHSPEREPRPGKPWSALGRRSKHTLTRADFSAAWRSRGTQAGTWAGAWRHTGTQDFVWDGSTEQKFLRKYGNGSLDSKAPACELWPQRSLNPHWSRRT